VIVAGERDPWKLAALSHPQIQATSQEEVATAQFLDDAIRPQS